MEEHCLSWDNTGESPLSQANKKKKEKDVAVPRLVENRESEAFTLTHSKPM